MNTQTIETLTRNEIWNHINEFQLPVKKYPSTAAARAALVAYYAQQPLVEETIELVAELPTLIAVEIAELIAPQPEPEKTVISKPSPSGAAVAVLLLVLITTFLRVLAVSSIVTTMLLIKVAAGLPVAAARLKASLLASFIFADAPRTLARV
jgi:hypothetical protein